MRKVILVLGLGIITLLSSCEDIFEPNISSEVVELQSPADQAVVSRANIRFSWGKVEGARSYNLVLASPSFNQPEAVYIDTTIQATSAVLSLQPGSYQWRVKALNTAYETAFSARSFELDSTSSLTGSEVVLKSPANGIFTNKKTLVFSWEPIAQAERYIFQLNGETSFDTITHAASITKKFPENSATYTWKVTALNATGLAVSPSRTFMTDFDAPAAPELLFPRADTTVFSWPVTLKWNRASNDVLQDSVFLYASDRQTLVPGFPRSAETSFFSLSGTATLEPGEYFWAVRSMDRAANFSGLTPKRRFVVR